MLPSLSKLTLNTARKEASTSDAWVRIDDQEFWLSGENPSLFDVSPTDLLFWQLVKRLEEGPHVIQHEGPDETDEISEWKTDAHTWMLNTIGREAKQAYKFAEFDGRKQVGLTMMRLCADAGCMLYHPRRVYYKFPDDDENGYYAGDLLRKRFGKKIIDDNSFDLLFLELVWERLMHQSQMSVIAVCFP